MRRALLWTSGIAAGLGIGVVGAWLFSPTYMSRRALTPRPPGATTPEAAGVPFAHVALPSGDRTLIGWWVRAGAAGQPAPALLFFHGNASSIADYISVQRTLYRQGISSMVFDYTGFGASGGSASLAHAVDDAGRVARVFADSAAGVRRIAMGSGLGATVLLQAIDSVQPHVAGVIVEGVDASVKAAGVRSGRIPRWIAPLLRDIGDNVAAAARVRVPLLAVHSTADARAPIGDAERVVAAVPGPAALVRHWRPGHAALLASSRPCDWAPVIAFVTQAALPAARVDSTNACAAPAPADPAGARGTQRP